MNDRSNSGRSLMRLAGAILILCALPTAASAGMEMASPAHNGLSPTTLLPWLGVILVLIGIAVRFRGARPVAGGLLLLTLFFGGSLYAIQNYRRPGAMTPVEAQAMQMELPAPAGTAPVELATVERGPIENTVHSTGQAVGSVEQDVTPRVTGVIAWMPVYVGDTVRRGQVLARLDTSQSAPLVANQRAGLNMAEQGVVMARKDYQQALASIRVAHAEVGTRVGALEGAKADVTAAKEDRAAAQAQWEAAQSMVPDAEAQRQAALADQRYWQQEIAREQSLLNAGAVTQEEYQREKAQAENADAKVRQAEARIVQVQAGVRAAQAAVRKADAVVASAQSRIEITQSELNAHDAHVGSSSAMADSARQKIAQAQAAAAQAQAALAGAVATQGYSEIRAETDGVVTQRVVSPGSLVNPGQVILRIARISPIRLQANLTEDDLARVRVGARVTVADRNGERTPLPARVTSVAPLVDATARTGVVEVLLPNLDRRFLPGQYVTLEVATDRHPDALLIPSRALRYHTVPSGGVISTQATPTVWVAEPSGGPDGEYTVHEVAVTIGLSDSKRTEILSGLTVGQRVVVAGQDYLKADDTVKPVTESSGGASPEAPGTNRTEVIPPRASGAPKRLYTCIMHPEVVQDHPGNCPQCGMKLVLKRAGGAR